MQSALQMAFSIHRILTASLRWQFRASASGWGKKTYNPKMLSSLKIFDTWEFLHLKDEKNGAASGFSACFKHQGLSNPKLHWCCAGGTIHRWGLDSIKKIAVLIWRSGATGSFYIPKTLQICILILHHHCIQYYNTKDQPFPAARMDVSFVHLLGQHICRSPIWSGRHDKRWKTNLWGKEVIRTFLSKGDYGMPSKTFQYHTLKFQ